MQKIVDISKYINAEKPCITLFGKTYEVKNDKKTMLLMAELQRRTSENPENSEDADEKIIRLLLGETAGEEICNIVNEMPNYAENQRAVLLNIMALATGQGYEELEARFQRRTRE